MKKGALAFLGLMMAAASWGGGPITGVLPKRRKGRDLAPLDNACPRCGAKPGEDCDTRTLGRYPYHKARVQNISR